MLSKFPEEKIHLDATIDKLNEQLQELDEKVKFYEEEFKESKKYLSSNISEMDAMEILSNEKSISQIVNSGDFISKRKEKIKMLIDTPYFARIDFMYHGDDEVEKIYIGRSAFMDNLGEMIIYDWRAPISGMYYDFELGNASYDAPIGKIDGNITLKRQFKILKSNIEYVLESNISIGDEILQKELSNTSDQKMKNIVSTIQKEQNRIIRNEKNNTLIIQGVAGSGKTSIALHRVAYFLYKYRENLSAENIAIISPNKVFANYISNVLPELGEEPIIQLDLEDIATKELDNKLDFEKFIEQVNELLEIDDKDKIQRINYKSSLEFISLLDDYINYIDINNFNEENLILDEICIEKEFIRDRYNSYNKKPIMERFNKIAEDIIEKVKLEKISEKIPSKGEIRKKLLVMCKYKNTLDLYRNFFRYINKEELFKFKSKNILEYNDVFPYIYLKIFIEGINKRNNIKHLVVDEMQDYTPIQYMVLKNMYKCKQTLLGDFGQCINPYNSNSVKLLLDMFEDSEVVILNKSYRSTYEIIRFAQNILKQNIEPIQRNGEKPKIIKCENLQEELKEIENIIIKFNKSSYSTLGIMCKTPMHANEIYNKLSQKYDVNLLCSDSLEFKDGITISTIHMSKGLEFDEVIIPTVDSSLYKTEYDKNLLYIATTRAMHKLTLTHYENITEILKDVTE